MNKDFFPGRPDVSPRIYAYELQGIKSHEGLLKIGYTTRKSFDRIKEQVGTVNIEPHILIDESAIRGDGSSFTDHDVHRYLRRQGFINTHNEWYRCTVTDVLAAILSIRNGIENGESRTATYLMRPEQQEAVEKTMSYFQREKMHNPDKPQHFLWNAKMRFGKTFTTYQLAKKMGWKKLLILTFKPAVENAWETELRTHIDFEGWQFVSKNTAEFMNIVDSSRPVVCFGSFQDYLGKNSEGGIKPKNKWVHETKWDCVVLDEYHFGAWREGAKLLFGADRQETGEVEAEYRDGEEYFEEDLMPINTGAYLYLSGTPFRALASGEFIEDQIYNWTYTDEQRAKKDWRGKNNPYASLPRMVMMTYKLPDSIAEVAMGGEFNEFDLNTFFSAKGQDEESQFVYEDEVQKWLNLMRGSYMETTLDNLKLGSKKPPMPFSDSNLLKSLTHTFWFLPNVASCYAMRNLLAKRANIFYHEYQVIVAAGNAAGIGVDALPPVIKMMENPDPLKTKTITLSCGKLTTGVTVPPWTGIFMLRNTSSPETYFQAAFRVQSPWTVKDPLAPGNRIVLKEECYVFDFALNRALHQIVDYGDRLSLYESKPEKKIEEFIQFLPVLAYDDGTMNQIDAAGILDIVLSGTTATLLAKRWESALLVNVDNATLARLISNEAAMKALMSIEGFRSLNQDIEAIINKSEKVKQLQKKANEVELTRLEKKELSEEEKEYRSKRKQIQGKLIKFATRIPVFMYLTDFREETLKDVITQLEPGLFKKVTGLTIPDFELLVSLGVFNDALMNDAVYKFRRYEDPSLEYSGLNMHNEERVGLYSTSISTEDYLKQSGKLKTVNDEV